MDQALLLGRAHLAVPVLRGPALCPGPLAFENTSLVFAKTKVWSVEEEGEQVGCLRG